MAGSREIGAMADMTSAGAVKGALGPGKAGLVGAEGFEPPTLCSQSRCATRLRHAPTRGHRTKAYPAGQFAVSRSTIRLPTSQKCFIYATVAIH